MELDCKSFKREKFADYFVICGLNVTQGLEPDNLGEDEQPQLPLELSFKNRVLGHHPDNVDWNPFDSKAVAMLSLPKGLQFKTQKHARSPYFHSFIITKETGKKLYGYSYTFYEEVANKQICSALHTLQAMYITDLSQGTKKSNATHINADSHLSSRSLPRGFRLAPSLETSSSMSYYDMTKDTLFVTKSVSVICQRPFLTAARKFLIGIVKYAQTSSDGDLSLESYVYNILYQMPVPSPGCSVKVQWFKENVVCQQTGINELPLCEYSFSILFSLLGIDIVVQLFTCLLLENQVLLSSYEYERMMLVAECMTSLLYPFSWQHVYVPIVPASLVHFLDAPVPYIMGLQRTEKDDPAAVANEANICLVDIDEGNIILPEDIPQFPHKNAFMEEIFSALMKYGNNFPSLVKVLNKEGKKKPQKSNTAKGNRLLWNSNEVNTLNRYQRRKLSWSHDSDSGIAGDPTTNPVSQSGQNNAVFNRVAILQQSEALKRVQAIAKKSGVDAFIDCSSGNNLSDVFGRNNIQGNVATNDYLAEQKLNTAVREIFLNRFSQMFCSYENFIIHSPQDLDGWLSTRDSGQNFDKAAFLCDQHQQHLPFLARFLETQMFVCFIDSWILDHNGSHFDVFNSRIHQLKSHCGEVALRMSYEPCSIADSVMCDLEQRIVNPEEDCPPPPTFTGPQVHFPTYKIFPNLDSSTLNKQICQERHKKKLTPRKERFKFSGNEVPETGGSRSQQSNIVSDTSPAAIAHNNWKFVEQLLKECNSKTKRLLVEKLGTEAVELGHGESNIHGVEENTLIAGLCDLLERIWSHGRINKQGKSALWSHLLTYQEKEECNDNLKAIDSNLLTPDLSSMPHEQYHTPRPIIHNAINSRVSRLEDKHRSLERGRRGRSPIPDAPTLKPLPVSISVDMRNVEAMDEIKTPIGYARAWVRLALEKKLLSKHLRTLLSDENLLKSLFKRYAFLRCDEERDQFLYHLLSLNAVDFFCFTNTFTNTTLPYQVVIFPSRKLSASSTSANVWISIAGTLGETKQLPLARGGFRLVFQHKNLGVLTTVRIGHDNSGMSPNWMIEHVLVRVEITGHVYKFPCGRWLGRSIDDGSIERLLIGELVPATVDDDKLFETCSTPPTPRCRSPSMSRKSTDTKLNILDIQELINDAVNNIVKYFYKLEKERGSITPLLCGDMGLVSAMEQIMSYGFKSTRFFGKNLYLWDYLYRVQGHYLQLLQQRREDGLQYTVKHQHMRKLCLLVEQINKASHTLGKDDKFQLFICLGARDHMLSNFMSLLEACPVTIQMYEDSSFFKDSELLEFLVNILQNLNEFDIVLERSITKVIIPKTIN